MNITDVTIEQIRVARTILRFPQEHICKSIGISGASYSAIESEKSDPKLKTFRSIVRFFIDNGIEFKEDGSVSRIDSAR